jgi:hypothetical protein
MAAESTETAPGTRQKRVRRALVAEVVLIALACVGLHTCMSLLRSPAWSEGAEFGDLAGVEKRCGISFPPGSELVVGYSFRMAWDPALVAIVRCPGPPESFTCREGDCGQDDPTRIIPRTPALPTPASLGLSGEPRRGWVGVTDPLGGNGNTCVLWLWPDEDGDGTVVYMHWSMVQ